jgi:hypothetical protein
MSSDATDRRRSPRIEILGRLHGYTVAFDVPVAVREISLGGMTVQTGLALEEGAVHEFLLTLGDGSVVQLSGRVLHTRRGPDPAEGHGAYISGIQFVEDEPDAAGTVEDVIDKIL